LLNAGGRASRLLRGVAMCARPGLQRTKPASLAVHGSILPMAGALSRGRQTGLALGVCRLDRLQNSAREDRDECSTGHLTLHSLAFHMRYCSIFSRLENTSVGLRLFCGTSFGSVGRFAPSRSFKLAKQAKKLVGPICEITKPATTVHPWRHA
jgi:hypothetical protein